MELNGKYVFLSEGVRGSLSKQVIAKYNLDAECDVPKFGLGMKEIWEVKPEHHNPGRSDPFHGLADGLQTIRAALSCITWKIIKSMSALLLI
jgi:flavin-dependent dehydrogenase